MTLDIEPADPIRYDIRIDGEHPEEHRLLPAPRKPGELPPRWHDAVQDYV